ncbi:MAG: amidohydrolase family protein [Sandaracinaceae bacterium]
MIRYLKIASFIAVLWLPASAFAQSIVLTGGTLLSPERDPVENATIVVRDGRIVSVSSGGAAPAGAQVLDCAGTTITAGFVGIGSPIGMMEIEAEPSTTDHTVEVEDADPVRAAFSAADAYNPRSTLIPVARRWGVTSVVSEPAGGLVSGTSAWMDLRGRTLTETMVLERAAIHVDLGDGGVAASGGSRASALMRLREVLDDARLFRQNRAAYDRRAVRELSVSRLDLERLTDALERRLPVVFHVSRASDILRALELGRTYNLRVVLSGAEEAWMVAAEIAAADVPVILQPLTDLPSGFSQLFSRYDNAALLASAGVRLAITVGADAHGLRNLRQEAGNAVAWGLDPARALAALTSEPARIFGVDDRYGTVAPGRIANLVVWTGDPFELTTWPRNVIVRGEDVPLTSRQTRLFERYRDLRDAPRGQATISPVR